ncbi:hypothetical protein [Prosthecobacter sp.]|uniref:hypothetical protein n=1 Tax=Prosthecobacter sp. TaxID=1965333 RepID=UPI002AB854C9|nr:hypothetical protein [Prosthecobacter sp.]MDZ4401624.1 hypothetical protein [Prosthecobacter sp.]
MPTCQIEEYQDSQQARAELIPWLIASDPQPLSIEIWQRRLSHWWDQNPFASLRAERGWLLRHEDKIGGFLGLIPTCYAVNGRPVPAFIASTWRVDEAHRNASLPMLMKFRRMAAETLTADTTPTPKVQALLQRSGWSCLTDIQRRFVPLGLIQKILQHRSWPLLPSGRRISRDPSEVQRIAASCMSSAGIEKWITPEYLRWFAASPMRRHEFIGVIDASDCLSSYIFITPKRIRGLPAWMEIDHFSVSSDSEELHALVGEIVRNPSLLGNERLLSLAAFPGDTSWDVTPVLHQRTEHVCHCFAIPEALETLPKRTVLAEGDWGL